MPNDPATFLYVIGYENGPCKIGYSINPSRRARAIQRGGHVEAVVLDQSIPINSRVAFSAERYAHWLLREHHLEHEWFNVTKADAIAAAKKAVEPGVMRDHDYRDLIPHIVRTPHNIKDGENIMTRYPAGTRGRIVEALGGVDGMADFIREAVEAELARREASSAGDG